MNAKKTASDLIESGYDLAGCQEVQNERIRRLRFWQEKDFTFMIKKEKQLIAFGEEVLTILSDHKLSPRGKS